MPASPAAPWRRMLILSALMALAVFAYKLTANFPGEQYTHLLADYHFGFIKRALVGATVGLVFPVLPWWSPYAFGSVTVIVAGALYVAVFRRAFGFAEQSLPLLLFTAGSPLFLKNFIQNLGSFDVLGCILGLVLLLVPARSRWYVAGAVAGCAALILVHHLHTLLYIPAIVVIVVLRHYCQRPLSATGIAGGALALLALGLVAIYVQLKSSVKVSPEAFMDYLKTRMTDPSLAPRLPTGMFFQDLAEELKWTGYFLPRNLSRIPVYVVVIALHAPLIAYAARAIRAVADLWQRRLVLLGMAGVTLGYVVIFAVVFDYSRWVASWSVCLLLILCAARMLPQRAEPAPIPLGERRARGCGWAVALLPRLGTTIPF